MSTTAKKNNLRTLEQVRALPQPVIPDNTPAFEVRAIHQKHAADNKIPYFPLTGYSYPLKKLLWVWGREFIKDAEGKITAITVPAHKWPEAQKAINDLTAKIEENKAKAEAKRALAEKSTKRKGTKAKAA